MSMRSSATDSPERRWTARPLRWWVIGGTAAPHCLADSGWPGRSASDVQYADYWLMLPEVLAPGGGLR